MRKEIFILAALMVLTGGCRTGDSRHGQYAERQINPLLPMPSGGHLAMIMIRPDASPSTPGGYPGEQTGQTATGGGYPGEESSQNFNAQPYSGQRIHTQTGNQCYVKILSLTGAGRMTGFRQQYAARHQTKSTAYDTRLTVQNVGLIGCPEKKNLTPTSAGSAPRPGYSSPIAFSDDGSLAAVALPHTQNNGEIVFFTMAHHGGLLPQKRLYTPSIKKPTSISMKGNYGVAVTDNGIAVFTIDGFGIDGRAVARPLRSNIPFPGRVTDAHFVNEDELLVATTLGATKGRIYICDLDALREAAGGYQRFANGFWPETCSPVGVGGSYQTDVIEYGAPTVIAARDDYIGAYLLPNQGPGILLGSDPSFQPGAFINNPYMNHRDNTGHNNPYRPGNGFSGNAVYTDLVIDDRDQNGTIYASRSNGDVILFDPSSGYTANENLGEPIYDLAIDPNGGFVLAVGEDYIHILAPDFGNTRYNAGTDRHQMPGKPIFAAVGPSQNGFEIPYGSVQNTLPVE